MYPLTSFPLKRYAVRFANNPADDFERAWDSALILEEFSLPWGSGRVPRTEFRALWTSERFYFRFDCLESSLTLARGASAREAVANSDRVELYLATTPALERYYCLEIDAGGHVLSYGARYHRQFDWRWTCAGLEVASQRSRRSYRVRGSIPWATLRRLRLVQANGSQLLAGIFRAEWGGNRSRLDGPAWLSWSSPGTPEPDFHVPSSFGELELVGGKELLVQSSGLGRRSEW